MKSDELISKEDVIELIEEVCPIYSSDYRFILKDRVKNLPSINLPIKEKCQICPHCKHCDVDDDGVILPSANRSGHWIDDGDCSICSKCHEAYGLTLLGQLYTPNFCPNCGADMKGEDND